MEGRFDMIKKILKVKELSYGRLFKLETEDRDMPYFVEPEMVQQNKVSAGDIITAFVSGDDIIAYVKEGGER